MKSSNNWETPFFDERKPNGWRLIKLTDAIKLATCHIGADSISVSKYVSTENMVPNRGGIIPSSSKPNGGKITEFKEDDILLSNIRTYFKKIWLAKFDGGCSNDVLVLRPREGLTNPFLYYYLSQEDFFNYTVASSKGTKMPRGDKEAIMKYLIMVPPVEDQRAISKILSDLDSKIELNQRMNKALESIVEAIFKHWFIDFEFPNEDGKPYKSSGGEMVESEIGEIPAKWSIKSLDSVADFLNGLALQKYPSKDDEDCLPVIKIREMNNGITDSTDRASSNIPPKYIVDDGDVIFSWSGSLRIVIWGYGKGALNQHLFKVTSKNYPKWFYYHWLLRYLKDFVNIAKDKATTMGHIQRHHLSESLIAVPDDKTFLLMNTFFNPIMESIINHKVEARLLSELRDSLLPKLISGKIRVPLEGEKCQKG